MKIFIYFTVEGVEDESSKNSSTTSNPTIGKYSIKRFWNSNNSCEKGFPNIKNGIYLLSF